VSHDRIVLDPAILAGEPVIRGTRLSVEFIIGLRADGWSEAAIVENYPGMAHDVVWIRETSPVGRPPGMGLGAGVCWQNAGTSSS